MAKTSKAKKTKAVEPAKFLRAPIVTIMGHVDHGKTSILDAIRKSRITFKESGGITQHIGAYTIERNGKNITFIDTPGHEAFSQMRARGGAASDIVILVVAADDGVMPQTKEAISHAKASGVPIIVAVNKIDLPGADTPKIKRQLSESGILVEGYGGDIPVAELSAKTGQGLDSLLDLITLVAELDEQKFVADPKGQLEAVIIEAKHDSKKGTVVSAVVKNGTLKIKDEVITPTAEGKIKLLTDSWAKSIVEAQPGLAVEILGFSSLPSVGDNIYRKGEKSLEEIKAAAKTAVSGANAVMDNSEEAKKKRLSIIVRADTQGTQEALVASLKKLKVDEAVVDIMFAGTGDIKESDILLASTSAAVVIAFRTKVADSMMDLAKSHKIIIREHDIIYKVIEEIEGALEGVLEIEEAKIKGTGFVIQTFTLPKSGDVIAGTMVEAGKYKLNARVGIFRGGNMKDPVHVTRIRSIHIGKNEVEVAKKGQECGLLFKPPITDIQLDDVIVVL
jgi:translation initiation factor IF-2